MEDGPTGQDLAWRAAIALTDSASLGILVLAVTCVYFGSLLATSKHAAHIVGQDEPVELSAQSALVFPIVASLSLVFVYFFFAYIQLIYIALALFMAGASVQTLLTVLYDTSLASMLPKTLRLGSSIQLQSRRLVSVGGALTVVGLWVLTDGWLLLDILGCSLCMFIISVIRIPTTKIALFLGIGLLLYDMFWVFYSPVFFRDNVMVEVAVKQADNPVSSVTKALHVPFAQRLPKLALPAKIMFPSWYSTGHDAMLGLGDIAIPGLFVAHMLRLQQSHEPPRKYFMTAVIGYAAGMVVAILASRVFGVAQPALIYLVPAVFVPTIFVAWRRRQLSWLLNHRDVTPPAQHGTSTLLPVSAEQAKMAKSLPPAALETTDI